eukprot:scaffold6038_cov125-Amphora_coffeaeformis.AAC.5
MGGRSVVLNSSKQMTQANGITEAAAAAVRVWASSPYSRCLEKENNNSVGWLVLYRTRSSRSSTRGEEENDSRNNNNNNNNKKESKKKRLLLFHCCGYEDPTWRENLPRACARKISNKIFVTEVNIPKRIKTMCTFTRFRLFLSTKAHRLPITVPVIK